MYPFRKDFCQNPFAGMTLSLTFSVLLFYAFTLIGLGVGVLLANIKTSIVCLQKSIHSCHFKTQQLLILNLRDKRSNFQSANALLRNTLTSISLN